MKHTLFGAIRTPDFLFKHGPHVETPRMLWGPIFDVVQLSHTLLDSLTFVDSVPRFPPRLVKKAYTEEYASTMSIGEFVRKYFILPEEIATPRAIPDANAPAEKVEEYINKIWDVLTRGPDAATEYSSLLPLPCRYVVPGGRFRSVYYWDSYFTMLGLKESGRIDLLEEMVKNFAYTIDTYGFIPNGNRSYYLTRSQPPVFALMVSLLADAKGSDAYQTYLPQMLREYAYWMGGADDPLFKAGTVDAALHVVRMPDGEILNRFFDASDAPREEGFAEDVELARTAPNAKAFYRDIRAGAESGWDYTSRWFRDGKTRETIRTTDIVPVDLNALLSMMESIIAKASGGAGKNEDVALFRRRADQRAAAMRKYFWNGEQKWYMDYVHSEKAQSPYLSLAGMAPLFAGIASRDEAKASAETLEKVFLREGGLVSTPVITGEQWDAPNGWAPLQYLAIQGLEQYELSELAETIARKWCTLVISTFRKTGTLLEKYNVENSEALASGGEYPLQDGFGWTNGTLLALLHRYHIAGE